MQQCSKRREKFTKCRKSRSMSNINTNEECFVRFATCLRLTASSPTSIFSQQENSESGDTTNSPALTTTTPVQASAKLEKLLADADEAFWASRKLTQMAGWTIYKTPRPPSSGKGRRSSVSWMCWTNESSAPLSGAAGRSTLTPDFLRQQLQQLAARNAARSASIMAAEESEPSLRQPSTRQRKTYQIWQLCQYRATRSMGCYFL